jgi:hypothetical protein
MMDAAAIVALRLQLIDAGWRPVPASPRDKSCHVIGWPTIEPNEFYVDNWARTHSAHTLTSIVCGQHIVALDLDVLDAERADRVQALAFQHLGVTGFIRIGRAPKRLLVYRQPYTAQSSRHNGHATPTAIRSETHRFADNGALIEILSTGKLFVAFGVHPDTGLPYRWIGDATPLEDTPTEAPLVTQAQVDAFIAAVHAEIAPLLTSTSTGKPSATNAQRTVNADGLVTDGRENLLRDCIYRAANEIYANGDALTPQGIAPRGWELFVARAWLQDGKYQMRHALEKARALVRRVKDGRIKLTGNANNLREAAVTYPNIDQDKNANRERLEQLLAAFADAVAPTLAEV